MKKRGEKNEERIGIMKVVGKGGMGGVGKLKRMIGVMIEVKLEWKIGENGLL